MAFSQKTWKDRVTEHPNRRVLTPVDGATNTYDAARAEGNIMEEGDALSAASLNDLEQRVADEFGTKGQPNGIAGLNSAGKVGSAVTADSAAVGSALETRLKSSYCDVTSAAGQSIPTGVATVLTWGTEAYDNDDMHSTVSDTGTIYIRTAGIYLITAKAEWALNGTGAARSLYIRKNGVDIVTVTQPASSGWIRQSVSYLSNCAVNDYFQIAGYQDSGAALSVQSGARFSVVRLGIL